MEENEKRDKFSFADALFLALAAACIIIEYITHFSSWLSLIVFIICGIVWEINRERQKRKKKLRKQINEEVD